MSRQPDHSLFEPDESTRGPGDDAADPSGPHGFEEDPERPKGPLTRFPSPRHAVPALLFFGICYLATVIYVGYPQGRYLWLSGEALFHDHEYWRLVTSIITHADLLHLISNALILLVFGWMIRAYFGLIAFPVLSLIIGIATNLVTISLYDPRIKLIGASGMAYGMVAFWLVLYIKYDKDHRVPVRIMRAVGFALVMMFPSTFDPHVSYLAHAVGFVVGLLTGLLLIPVIRPSEH
jgi:rhomboid protease GluP